MEGRPRRVGVIGQGAIGVVVSDHVGAGGVPGAELAGVARRSDHPDAMSVESLIERSDLVVEAAGASALVDHGSTILSAGRDLVAVSTGALLDPGLFDELRTAGPGRLHLCSGAIGGLDMIRSVAAMGDLHRARITTTKRPAGLIQDHMTPAETDELRGLTSPRVLYEGDITGLVARFPASTNVAATLALAVGSVERVTGVVRADPDIARTLHVVEVEARAGSYRFEMSNAPSPANPRSSAVVAWSVIRVLRDLCGTSWRFV